MIKKQLIIGILIFLFSLATVFAGRLDLVKKRGVLHCGVNQNIPGFGFLDSKGQFVGFDVDFCRAVSAAVFSDPEKVKFVSLSASQRFTAIQSGEIDILSRNTTWTASRDGSVGVDFTVTTFYDGQGVLIKKDLGVKKINELEGATICAISGTTTEKNITDFFEKMRIKFRLLTFGDADGVMSALRADRCDAVTSDKSQLLARQFAEKQPEKYAILEETISKEPLGPVVPSNDSQWRDVVSWTIYGMIVAEEFGINKNNIDSFLKNKDPRIQRLLGITGNLGEGLGLKNDFVYQVVKKVGNYSDLFDFNLGVKSKFRMLRGLNSQWSKGGLLYAPPFR